MSSPSVITSQLIKDPLLTPELYNPPKNFYKLTPNEQPKTPLGPDWKFKGCTLSGNFPENSDKYKNFLVRSDDVWIISYPKTGTTWTIEMVWLLLNNFDFEKSKEINNFEKAPFLELHTLHKIFADPIEKLNSATSQRLIKSHLPMCLLPDQIWTVQPKIIYVTRNPMDAAVSQFRHIEGINRYSGDINTFAQIFMNGHCNFGPFINHVQEFWQISSQENVLFIKYEEMKMDLGAVIKKVSQFIDRPINEEQIIQMVKFLSFDSMKTNMEKYFNFFDSEFE